MNALTGVENLIKQPAILNCGYWAAYTDKVDDQHRLRDNYNTEGKIEEAEKTLRELCGDLSQSGANLILWFSIDKKPNKGGYRIPFYIPSANGMIVPLIGGQHSEIDIETRIKEGIEKILNEKERNDLIIENRELKREIDGSPLSRVFNRIAEIAEPHLPQLINGILPMNTTQAVGSISDDEQQKIAENAISRLNKQRPDLPFLLKKLADLADSKPLVFNAAISELEKL